MVWKEVFKYYEVKWTGILDVEQSKNEPHKRDKNIVKICLPVERNTEYWIPNSFAYKTLYYVEGYERFM